MACTKGAARRVWQCVVRATAAGCGLWAISRLTEQGEMGENEGHQRSPSRAIQCGHGLPIFEAGTAASNFLAGLTGTRAGRAGQVEEASWN